jgi:DNA primase
MSPSPIEAARSRHRLADVAARTGIDLARTSGSVTVCCPLPAHRHPDRSPSMRLHLDDNIFHCYGCDTTGDVVEWASQTEHVDWRHAIAALDSQRPLTNAWAGHHRTADTNDRHQLLAAQTTRTAQTARTIETAQTVETAQAMGPARRAATTTAATPTAAATTAVAASGRAEPPDLARTPVERVHAALAAAWAYYTLGTLHRRGVDYLAGRGIDITTVEHHTARAETGHTPARSDGLVAALRSRGFTDDELVDAGLASRHPDRPLRDFYRQRVLIPLRNNDNQVCGFAGRNVGDDRYPKYLNPPRTAIYDKSVNLYQPLPAPSHPDGHVIVVEGTLDALAIAIAAIRSGQADRYRPVTPSGKELSATQLCTVLELCHSPLVVAFDGDGAGREAASRLARRVVDRGRDVAVVDLPDGHDPASWLAAVGPPGLAAWDHVGPSGAGARRLTRPGPATPLHASSGGTPGVHGSRSDRPRKETVAGSRAGYGRPGRANTAGSGHQGRGSAVRRADAAPRGVDGMEL